MSLGLHTRPARRRLGLTPMIDVVFLILIFFMRAARFGLPQTIPLGAAGRPAPYDGPPRLVEIAPDVVRLNGVTVTDLAAALNPLMPQGDALVVLRPVGGASVQRLTDVILALRAAGITSVAIAPVAP